MPTNDMALLARWSREGDAEAFKEIASRYAPMVYGTCKRILRNGSEAEDAAQECFATLAFARKGPKEHLGAWLHAVATTCCVARMRSDKRRKAREARFASERKTGSEIQWDDVSAHVDEAIAGLPERLRLPIELHFFEDETHDAVARRLGVSRTTVTYRIQKGIEAIRKKLKRREIIVTSSALAAMMAGNLAADAAPKAMTVALAKVALAGTGSIATTGAGTALAYVGGSILMKKLLVGAVVLVLAGFALWKTQVGGQHGSPAETTLTSASTVEERPAEGLPPTAAGAHAEGGVAGSEDKGPGVVQSEGQVVPSGVSSLGSISGAVSDAETKAPIAGAFVQLSGAGGPNSEQKHVRTDENGRYRFGEVQPGSYKLGCEVMGVQDRSDREARTVSVAERQDVVGMDFMVARGLCIKGKVVDTEGRPVAKAMVVAARSTAPQAAEMEVNSFSAADGSFMLYFILAPGVGYVLSAVTSPMFGVPGDMLASEVEGPFFPSVDGLPEASLVLRITATISGTVVDTRGQPVAGARVIPRSDPWREFTMNWKPARTAEDGSFTTPGLPAGSYDLDLAPTATGKFIRALPPNDKIVVAWGERKPGLRLVLDLGLSISGHVVDEEGAPVVEANVRCADSYARTKPDGAYTLTGLTAGQQTVTVDHQEYVEISRDNVAVGSSGVDFTLTRRGAIEGRVVDAATGRPIERFEVMHFPEIYTPFYPDWERGLVAQTDENGAFRIPNVRPGRATVVARASGYLQSAVEVPYVPPAETIKDIVVRLERGLSVEGKVVDSAGQPVANASIIPGMLRPGQRPQEAGATQTDAEGKFALTSLKADVTAITAYHPAYPPASTPVTLVPGHANNVTIVFANGGTVEGMVYFEGAPWPGRTVQVVTRISPDTTTTSASGAYRVSRVPAGEASVLVTFGDERAGESSSYHSLSQSTIVYEGKTSVVDFDYVPGSASVAGCLTLDGQPVLEAQVTLLLTTPKWHEQHIRGLREDDAGCYRFEGLPAASAQLIVDAHSPQGSRRVEFDIQEGQAVRQDVDFSAGRSIEIGIAGLKPGEKALLFAIPGEVQVDTSNVEEVIREYHGFRVTNMAVTEDGVYRLGGLGAERYTVVAMVYVPPPGGGESLTKAVSTAPVDLSDESTQRIDLQLD